MGSRGNATALGASLALLVASLTAYLTQPAGVGTALERVTLGAADTPGAWGPPDPPPGGGPPAAPAPGPPASASVAVVDATRIPPPADVAPPRKLAIPSVDLLMPIEATGVTDDGQMELPEDPRTIGWYRFGSLPGQARGSAVLGGHVDSRRQGAGPLARLAAVRHGARVVVTGADGALLGYRVTSVQRIAKAALPVDRLFDPTAPARLVIVTCGGRYLAQAGGYEDNVVLTAIPEF